MTPRDDVFSMQTRYSRRHIFQVRPVSRRPTGLEIYELEADSLPLVILILLPGERAFLGTWPLGAVQSGLESAEFEALEPVFYGLLKAVLPLCRRFGCQELSLRLELPPDQPALDLTPFLPGFVREHAYQQLQIPALELRKNLLEASPCVFRLQRSQVPEVHRGLGPWVEVGRFPTWFKPFFRDIFDKGSDPEIAAHLDFQEALLELVLAASWQHPGLWIVSKDHQPVGMCVSRLLDSQRGELSYVGIHPDWQGTAGLGRGILMTGLEPLLALGVRQVECTVATANPRSLAFFGRKWGFSPTGREETLTRKLPFVRG